MLRDASEGRRTQAAGARLGRRDVLRVGAGAAAGLLIGGGTRPVGAFRTLKNSEKAAIMLLSRSGG